MPVTSGGRRDDAHLPAGMQLITFALEEDQDMRFKKWMRIRPSRNSTIAQIAARRGHPEDAPLIARRNKVRGINYVLWKKLPKPKKGKKRSKRKQYKRIWVPGELNLSLSFNAIAGDEPPKVTGGYAKYTTVDRPERVGINRFEGFDPIEMTIPIRFEAKSSRFAEQLETDIELLERMAGRGQFKGAAVGPPPIVHISTTGGEGNIVQLIPLSYQRTAQNRSGPLWRVVDIEWEDGALRGGGGRRRRQLATVTVRQHVKASRATRSVTKRSRTKKRRKKH